MVSDAIGLELESMVMLLRDAIASGQVTVKAVEGPMSDDMLDWDARIDEHPPRKSEVAGVYVTMDVHERERRELEMLREQVHRYHYTPCVHCETNERLKLLLRERGRLLEQVVLLYEFSRNANNCCNGLRMVPISERFIEAARAAGEG